MYTHKNNVAVQLQTLGYISIPVVHDNFTVHIHSPDSYSWTGHFFVVIEAKLARIRP